MEVSSVVKWGCQDYFKPVYFILFFFYEKISCAQEHSHAKINQQNKIKQTLNNKGNNISCAQTSKRVKVVCFTFWCFLCAWNLFVKKSKPAWNCLDNLISLYYCAASTYLLSFEVSLCLLISFSPPCATLKSVPHAVHKGKPWPAQNLLHHKSLNFKQYFFSLMELALNCLPSFVQSFDFFHSTDFTW